VRILVDITAHGFGHLSQTAPILAALRALGGVQYVVRSGLGTELLRQRLGQDIIHVPTDLEFGLVMKSPFQVDRVATMERYKALLDRFDEHVASIHEILVSERCDAVLSNVGFLAVAAGVKAGLPTFACSSLNWGDLFSWYCGSFEGAEGIKARIDETYRSATAVYRLVPGLPMTSIPTIQIDRPIARVGRSRRAELAAALKVSDGTKLILLAFGGMIPTEPPPFLRERDGLAVIGPRAWESVGSVPADNVTFGFGDLIASVDLVVTKPGYGIVAELGCSGTPSIFVSRNDWPEEGYLLDWLKKHSRFEMVSDIRQLNRGRLFASLNGPTRSEILAPSVPGGETDVASQLATHLDFYKGPD
jgi:hypothetical protein